MSTFAAIETTLGRFKAAVRGQVGAVSEQESGILSIEMNDLVHQAITTVRGILGPILDAQYETTETLGSITIASGEGSVTVMTNRISDVSKCKSFDTTLKEIPILSTARYNGLKSLYSSSDVGTTKGFATLKSTISTAIPTFKYYIFTGATGPLTTVDLIYPRHPYKVILDADTVDMPERFVPLARDICTLYVFKRLERQPSADVMSAVTAQLNATLATLGINITPNQLVK